jgi:diguanylate cyclase (GGDEF)-like protein
MKSKKSIFTSLTMIMGVMFLITIINITMNLRQFGMDSAKTKAQLVAQSVKNGLTAHMVNGIMDKRDFFLKQTTNLENIDNLWIIRSQGVENQYGKSNDHKQDDIDTKVLKSGKMVEKVVDNIFGHSTYRVTMPYKAEVTPDINCLQCHDVKEGDTLGVISMVITMDDLKYTGGKIILYTSLISFILFVIIMFFVRNLVVPYLSIFDSIKTVMQKAKDGDYTHRITNVNSGEAKEVAKWINEHMDKLQNNLISMEEKIDVFLSEHNNEGSKDPIIDVEQTVTRLADIYKFRKTIEHDETIDEVYSRFATVLIEKFNITNFNFIEADTTNKKTQIVYVNDAILCDPESNGCRSDRTNTLVDSCQFKQVCDKFSSDKYYFCEPYSISNDLDFIVSIVSDTIEEHERVRAMLPLIKDYVDTAKPEIVSKKLMQILERNAQTDPLTGLYNRKYLEKFIDTNLYQGRFKGKPCGVMMVDIDFFKLINDNYGHDIGDIAIKTIANTLTDTVSENDVVIRFGGEEFIVIVTDTTEDKMIQVAEEIRIAFSQQKIQANNEEFSKTVSIGCAYFENKQHNFWKYVKQSDIALYEAKQTGRNKVVKYVEGMK